MFPKILSIGPVTIHSFGFMLAVAFLIIAWLSSKEFVRRGYTADDAWSATFAAMIGGVLGAKLYFLIDHWSETIQDPGGMIFSGAGLTYYGGLFGGAIAVILVAKNKKIPIPTLLQISAPMIALGYGVGRLGCFLNGDDYGRVSDVPWAMAFPKGAPPTLDTVHPTQIYEATISLALFAILWGTRRRWDKRGTLSFGIFLLVAATERFGVEFFRNNDAIGLGMTMAQLISVILFILGIILIARPHNR